MYYDVEVKLTQGWFAYAYDLSYATALQIGEMIHRCNYLTVRLVPHLATV